MKSDDNHRIYTTSFASVYPHYLHKAEKKGRTKAEVDAVICWLTGYTQKALDAQITAKTDFEADAEDPLHGQAGRRAGQGPPHGQNPAHMKRSA